MRRTITILIASTILLAPMTLAPPAALATGRGPCSEQRLEVDRQMPTARRVKRMRALIRCVFTAVGIPGQISTALRVGGRESGLRPWARNPSEPGACQTYVRTPEGPSYGYCGTYQHGARYWHTRVTLLPERAFPRAPFIGPFQERANVWITAKMVKRGGWGPWSATV